MKKVYKCYIACELNKYDRVKYIVKEKGSDTRLDFVCNIFFTKGELQPFLSKAYKVGGKLLTKGDTSEYILVEGNVQGVYDDGTIKMYLDDSLNYSHQIEDNYIPVQFTPTSEQTNSQCLKSVADNGFALAYVAEEFMTESLCFTAIKQNWKAIQCVPQNMITTEFAIEAITLNKKSAKYIPEDIRERKAVTKVMLELGLIKITFKGYRKKNDDFAIEGSFCTDSINPERICKYFDSFDEFYKYADGELLDADLSKYKFKGIDLNAYNLEKVVVPAAVLKREGLYDDYFYRENVRSYSKELRSNPVKKNEIMKTSAVVTKKDDFDPRREAVRFYYISDLHLDEKIVRKFSKAATEKEITVYICEIVKELMHSKCINHMYLREKYLLIAGDVSCNYRFAEIFYRELVRHWGHPDKIVVILGNHELWGVGKMLKQIVSEYEHMFRTLGITFLHNELLLIKKDGSTKIKEKELNEKSKEGLEKECGDARFAILGSTGFSAYNDRYNATHGLYRYTFLTLEEDMKQTSRFNTLYKKVENILGKKKVIVLTHMFKEDWLPGKFNNNWIYVSGHTHMNNLIINEAMTLYADNQVGYYSSKFELKSFRLVVYYDIFMYYKDGIYKITREQYEEFNHGIGIRMQLNRAGFTIYMLKRGGIYCFIQRSDATGEIHLLDGGNKRVLLNQDINYYYINLEKYAVQLYNRMEKPNLALEYIAKAVKSFGGQGNIHGCIVDIDYCSHIFLNPYDGKVTPYYATSIVDKYVYSDLSTLLSERCPILFENYTKMSEENPNAVMVFKSTDLADNNEPQHEKGTDIYKASRVIKKLQYTTEKNVIRTWDDDYLNLPLDEHILFLE